MTLELAAFRLYAPYFGYSIYVWGSMISVVMAALAGGYALGGWIADRSRTDLPLYCTILSSAIYQFLILCTVQFLLPTLAQYGEFTGAALATLIVFAPPMAGLALVAPFIIRLLARSGHVGSTAGKVYALSTSGSIGGILATSFWLIPSLGTRATLLIACAVTFATSITGLIAKKRAAMFLLAPILSLASVPGASLPAGTVWVGESAYNLVRVVRSGSLLLLTLNDEGVHTIRDETIGWTGHYYDDFALGPLLVQARQMLVLGMGAGTSIATTRATAPEIELDAVEIDPKVIEAGVRFFGLQPDENLLRIHLADARPWLIRNHINYDLAQIDLYQGGPYIPFYLVTVEFFRLVRAHLSEDGLMMMNVFDPSASHQLLESVAATLKQVFPSVSSVAVGNGNHMVLAFRSERSIESIRSALRSATSDEQVGRLARKAASQIVELAPAEGTLIFTDDHAPVEEMTRHMLAEYRMRFKER